MLFPGLPNSILGKEDNDKDRKRTTKGTGKQSKGKEKKQDR